MSIRAPRAPLALLTFLALAVASTAVHAGPQEEAGEETAEGAPDKTRAPYFYVGGSSDTERLPLESTSADVHVAGVVAHVKVKQVFKNGAAKPIEAVYVFPASTRAAVHGMRMRIGARVIEARIDRKAKARADYEEAKSDGKRAALLEEHRSNVFTMNVANVMPGDRIEVELDYSEMLVPREGAYELVYPTVVGPRYTGGGVDPKVDPKKDAWMATPHLHEGAPPPYAFDLVAHVEAGIPLAEIASPSHAVAIARPSPSVADVHLTGKDGGDRDFVLRWRLAGDKVQTGVLLSGDTGADGERFFALMMEPPARPDAADVPPREFVFLVDVSGSMFGFPLDTTKALMAKLLPTLRPTDSFNVVLFSGAFRIMSPAGSVPVTPENVREALRMLGREQGGGGTELTGGLQAAYGVPRAGDRARTVVVVTDGYVGVEQETFTFIRERLGEANLFAFGIGSGVNRAIIEGMARAGSGEPFVILKPDQAAAETERFREYVDRPLLTHVDVKFDGFAAYDVAPAHLPDLMARRPLVLFGKYRGTAPGKIVVTGTTGRGPFRRVIDVDPRRARAENAPLRWLWARRQVEWLEDERALGPATEVNEPLAELGLRYSLLTSETSFVAIDHVVANPTGRAEAVNQPLPLPAGVSDRAVGVSVGMSRSSMPPGDPVLTVQVGRDARAVTAYFPFGLVKDLAYDAFAERWQTRFLVPKDVADGEYRVPVVVTLRDGRTEIVEAKYRIDSAAPDFDVEAKPVAGGVELRVVGHEKLRQVVVALVDDPGIRVELTDAGNGRLFFGRVSLPPGLHRLRVVVADEARNEADDVLPCEVP
jgi:Ca-activated chloride channel family protein